MENCLYYGDNLDILRRYIKDESVDLIYLDPPFNSKATYNMLFEEHDGSKAAAQFQAFEDTWHWDHIAAVAYQEVAERGEKVSQAIIAIRQMLGETDMLAYLSMMAIRLIELRRVLKPTSSIYLHCDPTASHYLKILMDSIFGVQNYQNEVIWKRTSSHSDAKRYPKITDTILFYSKSQNFIWNKSFVDYGDKYISSHYTNADKSGRIFRYDNLVKPKGSLGYFYTLLGCPPPPNGWRMPESRAELWISEGRIEIPPKGKVPAYKRFLDEMEGTLIPNLWTDISPLNSQGKDTLGYPTQKPSALLERIIQASSNPGDLVLDPFCGCGTAVVAAQKLGRRWIGIDVTHVAITVMKQRLIDTFEPDPNFKVIGEPTTVEDAQELAQTDPYQFQWWALGLVGARPIEQKKGADKGIDGRLYFHDTTGGETKQIIFSVKAGNTNASHVRDLHGVIDRENAAIGVLITMEDPTKPMRSEAASGGTYTSQWGTTHSRLQIFTIKDLLEGKKIDMPPVRQVNVTFKKASKPVEKGIQPALLPHKED
jgi:DNA modification methylase